MVLNSEWNVQKNEIEKAEINVGYNKIDKSIHISTQNNTYFVIIPVQVQTKNTSEIEQAATKAVADAKQYLIKYPEMLGQIGSALEIAIVNTAGMITATNLSTQTDK